MIIFFEEFGKSLGTRFLGEPIRLDIIKKLEETDDSLIFDFKNVRTVTNSFADEVFGKAINYFGFEQFKARTTFVNLNEFTELCVKKAIVNRVSEQIQN